MDVVLVLSKHVVSDSMNQYKQAWMLNSGIIHDNSRPDVRDSTKNSIPDSVTLGSAIGKTARAAAVAVAISQVDGPLPFADVVALAYFSTSALSSWHDYFS